MTQFDSGAPQNERLKAMRLSNYNREAVGSRPTRLSNKPIAQVDRALNILLQTLVFNF
jgi:hypothetical protein